MVTRWAAGLLPDAPLHGRMTRMASQGGLHEGRELSVTVQPALARRRAPGAAIALFRAREALPNELAVSPSALLRRSRAPQGTPPTRARVRAGPARTGR